MKRHTSVWFQAAAGGGPILAAMLVVSTPFALANRRHLPLFRLPVRTP